MSDSDYIQSLCASIQQASSVQQALQLTAGGSKNFYGNQLTAASLDVSSHTGIVDYEPTELFISARNGTLLCDLEATLDANNQMFPFEPPGFTQQATLGGTVACGLSGPRRPYASAMRDCVLGTNIVNGKGEYLEFGGNVMKNVAGYDVSRLMCGAFGTLGVLTQVSLKVIPKPQTNITVALELSQSEALKTMSAWMQTLFPISATYFNRDVLFVRIEGLEKTTKSVLQKIGGEILPSSQTFWKELKDHQTEFFQTERPLWRVIIPNNTPPLSISGESCLEWNGGLRWIKSDEDAQQIISQCHVANGHATLFKAITKPTDCLASIQPKLQKLHLNLKSAFDPQHILNPGRMYSWC